MLLLFCCFSSYVTSWLNGGNTSLCIINERFKAFTASNQSEGDFQPESKETLEILQHVGAPVVTGSDF